MKDLRMDEGVGSELTSNLLDLPMGQRSTADNLFANVAPEEHVKPDCAVDDLEVRVEHYCDRSLSLTSISLASKHGKRYLLACRRAEGGLLQGPLFCSALLIT